jgi:plasmid maintenance system antidote protein VapI
MNPAEHFVDDKGTTQQDARKLLWQFCDEGFGGNVEETAVVLGRTTEEIRNLLEGTAKLDDDLAMKLRGIAQERGIKLQED